MSIDVCTTLATLVATALRVPPQATIHEASAEYLRQESGASGRAEEAGRAWASRRNVVSRASFLIVLNSSKLIALRHASQEHCPAQRCGDRAGTTRCCSAVYTGADGLRRQVDGAPAPAKTCERRPGQRAARGRS